MGLADDVSIFFNPDDFVDEVIFGNNPPFYAHFDNIAENIEDRVGKTEYPLKTPLTSPWPRLICQSADVTGLVKGTSRLSVNDVTYKVVDLRADGKGITLVYLHKV